jgi:hypothetical protein
LGADVWHGGGPSGHRLTNLNPVLLHIPFKIKRQIGVCQVFFIISEKLRYSGKGFASLRDSENICMKLRIKKVIAMLKNALFRPKSPRENAFFAIFGAILDEIQKMQYRALDIAGVHLIHNIRMGGDKIKY